MSSSDKVALNIFFHLTGKPGKDSELRALLGEMTSVSRLDDGCIGYTFHQQKNDPRQLLLHEQWRDRAALDAHVAHMKSLFGAPPPNARLPARLHELSESCRAAFYDQLG